MLKRFLPRTITTTRTTSCSLFVRQPVISQTTTARYFTSNAKIIQVSQHRIQGSDHDASMHTPNQHDTTRLVDNLLDHTRQLMNAADNNSSTADHIIAFSGGVDSSLVAQLLHQVRLPDERVTAVLGLSPAVPQDQVELATKVAQHVGIDFRTVPTTEGDDATYIANAGQACYACKTHLYTTLRAICATSQNGNATGSTESSSYNNSKTLYYNGTNADDLLDPTRLGLIAAKEFQIQSPLRSIAKDQVRQAARHLNLPNWDYAASPCLRSRLALGVPATSDHLQRIELAETLVREALDIDSTVNMRVRLLSGNRACIEVDSNFLEVALGVDLNEKLLQLGKEAWLFEDVKARAFKSGSVSRSAEVVQ